MKVSKKYNDRLNEILDAGEVLFSQKGYEKTAVNDILDYVGIGKGTFYHYFKSKEEVMDSVIMRVVEQYAKVAREIADNPNLDAHQKFANIILGQADSTENKEQMIEELHQVENARMHQKSIVETIAVLVPILTDVINQGIKEGTFHSLYPQETIEILLVSNQFLFDNGIFCWESEQILKKAEAFVYSMELLLGTGSGSFQYILEYYKKAVGGNK